MNIHLIDALLKNYKAKFYKALEIIEDEVYNDADFQRHLKEVAQRTNMPLSSVESVVKHYIESAAKEVCKNKKHKRRFIFSGYFFFEIHDIQHNPYSSYKVEKKRYKEYIKKKYLLNKSTKKNF